MRVIVDRSLCDNYGQCVLAAEDVFGMDDGGVLQYDAEPDESHRAAVEEAVDLCPVQAILLEPA